MSDHPRAAAYRVLPFDLRLFAAVVEHGSITGAASVMSLSLAAASARLKALEASVAVRLLDRSKAGAAPTPAGRAFARHAERVLAELESLHSAMARFGRGLRGTIRLLCNTAAMADPLPPRLGRFLVDHPDFDVALQEASSDAVLDALRSGRAELGIVADYVDPEGLVSIPWLPDRLVAVVPAKHAVAHRRTVSYTELLAHPMVGLSPESGLSRFLTREAQRGGRTAQHRVRVSGFDAAAQLVAASVGVGVMPERAAERSSGQAVRVVPLSDPWAERQLLICLNEEARRFPGVQALIESLCSA
ncbi:LysR family transcriptional regulator [Piscinibacter koreensis]|uniref:LysR family transcriptional regulator n=1 Tax=Piscinibacter koreensis TaxID=2742824 RepID=A0A7Y6NT85_9BURK|nr:LysR family transcriptional regulator [Schlegelella koreensis]NUZ08879.1 LysR family transcriptional regulator [Schlegelella koreensis]